MARYTSAYSSFVKRLEEVEWLRRLAAAKERQDAMGLRHGINALCRGAIVLLCAHLEAFVRELGQVALDAVHEKKVQRTHLDGAIFYHLSKDLIDKIADSSEPRKVADKMFDFILSDIQYWSREGPFPAPVPTDRFNKGFSNPAFKRIKAYFRRFGYRDYRRNIDQILKGNSLATLNMIDHLVDTRNKIAHGDPTATKTPEEVKVMMGFCRVYCSVTDTVFAEWCKQELCTIR